MLDTLLEKFSTHCRRVIKNALQIAASSGATSVHPYHIPYSLSQQRGSVGAEVLRKANLDPLTIKRLIPAIIISPKTKLRTSSPATKKLLQKATVLAHRHQHSYVGTEHLLSALLQLDDQYLNQIWNAGHVNRPELIRTLEVAVRSVGKFSELTSVIHTIGDRSTDSPLQNQMRTDAQTTTPVTLDQFAVHLTDPLLQKKLDPVIGREVEIDRLIHILARRHKNNPLLIGEPGVGKTALVEGLAKRIVEHAVPTFLKNKKIYALDLAAIVAGTNFRGEFEQRLKTLLGEIKRRPEVIVFTDELHSIIGAGSATGAMDAANILKPALARGDLRCIGATTFDDYKKHIESDPALQRRFQPITIGRPTVDQTLAIIKGVKQHYENFHNVILTDEAIRAAVTLSDRYITDRQLPDKAIDVIDEAAAAVTLRAASRTKMSPIDQLEQRLEGLRQKKITTIHNEQFALAIRLHQQAQALSEELDIHKQHQLNTPAQEQRVTVADAAAVISRATGVPVQNILVSEKQRLVGLEKMLRRHIVGQDQAVSAVSDAIRRSRTGISPTQRPIGSFMFLGPSGVGKTELARVLAREIFGSTDALIKLDMSEFAESFSMSKLIGAPAGYVGYKEPAKLTDAIKQRPYAVVLFDEIEKAHPSIFHLLLQLLEDGYITDATGKKINFRNTIIILTSNLGSEAFNRFTALGFRAEQGDAQTATPDFASTEHDVRKKLRATVPPELLDRLDHIIVFKPLTLTEITVIAKRKLRDLEKRLQAQGITLTLPPTIARHIATLSVATDSGARAVQRTIQQTIVNKIATRLLLAPRKQLVARLVREQITF